MAYLIRRSYSTTDPATGQKIRKRAKAWYIRFKDHLGVWRTVKGCSDKQASQTLAAELERKAERRKVGRVDAFDDAAARPLAEHLADYRGSIESKGGTGRHVREVVATLSRVFTACKWRMLADLNAVKLEAYLQSLRAAGRSPRTINYALGRTKEFCGWLVVNGRMPANPLAHLKPLNEAVDVRRVRRALTADECRRLLETVRQSTRTFRGLDGADRHALYGAALGSGFRAKELSSLVPEDFRLNDDPPTIRLIASNSKNRKPVEQPIPTALAETLAEYLDRIRREPSKPVWPGEWRNVGAEMIAKDLADAGIEATGADGAVVDFHSLRHTFCTLLAKSGATPKELQLLARHHTAAFTLDRYAHASVFDLADAVQSLPALSAIPTSPPEAGELRRTGTDPADRVQAEVQARLPISRKPFPVTTCDDSLTDSGSVSLGSNPSTSASSLAFRTPKNYDKSEVYGGEAPLPHPPNALTGEKLGKGLVLRGGYNGLARKARERVPGKLHARRTENKPLA